MKFRMIGAAIALGVAFGLSSFGSVRQAERRRTPLQKLKVGYIPVGVYSYLWRARGALRFKAEKSRSRAHADGRHGGQIIPALQSGSLQFGISDALGVLNARNAGIPITYVSFNFAQASDDPVHLVADHGSGDQDSRRSEGQGRRDQPQLQYRLDHDARVAAQERSRSEIGDVPRGALPRHAAGAAQQHHRGRRCDRALHHAPLQVAGCDGPRVLFHRCEVAVVFSGIVAMQPYVEKNKEVVRRFLL